MSVIDTELKKIETLLGSGSLKIKPDGMVEVTKDGADALFELQAATCKIYLHAYTLWYHGKKKAIEQGGGDIEWYNKQEGILVDLAKLYYSFYGDLIAAGLKFPDALRIMMAWAPGGMPAWLDTMGLAPVVIAAIVVVGGLVVGSVLVYSIQSLSAFYSSAAYNKNLIEAAQYMTPAEASKVLKDYETEEPPLIFASAKAAGKAAATALGPIALIAAAGVAAFFFLRR